MVLGPCKRRKKNAVGDRGTRKIAVLGDLFVDVQASIPKLPEWDADVATPGVDILPGGSAANAARQLAVGRPALAVAQGRHPGDVGEPAQVPDRRVEEEPAADRCAASAPRATAPPKRRRAV